jgi:hypothetical protein
VKITIKLPFHVLSTYTLPPSSKWNATWLVECPAFPFLPQAASATASGNLGNASDAR